MCFCAYCKCANTVDVPVDNASNMARNVAKMRGHWVVKDACEVSKSRGGENYSGYCRQTYECAPKMPPMEC